VEIGADVALTLAIVGEVSTLDNVLKNSGVVDSVVDGRKGGPGVVGEVVEAD